MAWATPVAAQPGDWTVRRDPFDRAVIARYQAILARDPHDPALAKLAQLYQTYRKLSQLIDEYDAKLAAAPESWAVLVVIGRLLELDGQRDSALTAFHRAWTANPDDARLAIRIGTLSRALNKPAEAQRAFEHAAAHGDKGVQREAVKALLELARADRDRVAQMTLAKRLSDLDPGDPRLQLDKGDALFAIDLVDGALEAYAAAEKLYASDPARRVEAIVRRGRALERRDRAAAEVAYRQAIASVPKGHYLRTELFGRIVELHRKAGTLGGLLAESLAAWPEAARGVFEWYELSKLHDAVGDQVKSIAALEKAVARASEPKLHLELADRYPRARSREALAILDKLVARSPRDAGVLGAVAERYARAGQLRLAIATYDKLARLDIAAEERMIDLVEELFRKDDAAAGIAAARAIADKLHTAANHGRLGIVLLEFGQYQDSSNAFTRAIDLDKTNPEWWRGRAAARDANGHRAVAIDDAWRVIELSTEPKARRTARRELGRIVMRLDAESGLRRRYLDDWRTKFAADPPNVDAGLLLLTYYEMSPCDLHQAVEESCEREVLQLVDRLSELGEIDVADVIAVATAYSAAALYGEALAILDALERAAPAHRAEIADRKLRVADGRRRTQGYLSWSNETIDDPDHELIFHRRLRRNVRPAIHAPLRLALRLGAGAGLRGSTDRASAGVMAAARLGNNVSLTARLDGAKHAGAFDTIGGSVGISKAVLPTRHTVFVLGIAERLEHRRGDLMRLGYDPIGLAAEATIDLVGRRIPLSAGLRFQQGMSDDGRETSLAFELGVELR